MKRFSKGQVIIEYLLLLVVGVTVATLLITSLVKRDINDPGFLIQAWYKVLEDIGADYIDE